MEETFVERLDPLNDYLFFKITGKKGDEEQLMAFINAVWTVRMDEVKLKTK
jgi:hypothetical protein